MPDPVVGAVPFTEAIAYLRNKLRLPTATWTDLWQGEHARAFVVAGATKDALLKDLHGAVLKAIEGGTTLDEFRRDFDGIVAAHGWSYRGGRNWRTRVIYNTNLRMAHAAGKFDQAQRLKKARPFLRYVAIDDGRTREQHRTWHNTILPVDDAFWDSHFPPNGWNCRCTVQSLSERDLERYGLKVSEKAPPIEMVDRDVNFPDGRRTIKVPDGIDPGFAYNPGQAASGKQLADDVMDQWREADAKAWEELTPGDALTYGLPRELPEDIARAKVGETVVGQEARIAAVEKAIGGQERIFDVPDRSVVAVNAASLGAHLKDDRSAFIPFLPEVLTDPAEVWLSFVRHKGTGRVELRKRLLKVIVDEESKRGYILSVQVVRGRLEAYTFLPSKPGYLQQQRRGKLLFVRRREEPAVGEE